MADQDMLRRVAGALDALDPSPELPSRISARVAQRERQRQATRRAGAALAVVIAFAGVGALAVFNDGQQQVVASNPRPPLRWESLPAPPIPPRQGPSAAWTGSEMVFWGGSEVVGDDGASSSRDGLRADGAAYDPSTQRWRVLAPAPIGPRAGNSADWTGKEVVVWGGFRPTGEEPSGYADGAAYNPASDSWRLLPPGPLGPRVGPATAWTGTELLFVGGSPAGDDEGTPVGAAYDPERDTWRALADPGLDGTAPGSAIWTGTELLYWRSAAGKPELLAYDPKADVWAKRSGPGRRFRLAWDDAAVAWTGQRLVVVSRTLEHGDWDDVEAIAYEPVTDSWQRVALTRNTRNALFDTWATAMWTGRELVVISRVGVASTLDLASGDWRPTAPMPPSRYGPTTIIAGGDGDSYVWGDDFRARLTRQPRR